VEQESSCYHPGTGQGVVVDREYRIELESPQKQGVCVDGKEEVVFVFTVR